MKRLLDAAPPTSSLQLRIPRSLIEHLAEEAQRNGRSLNSEIAMRLASTLDGEYSGPSPAMYIRRAK